MLSFLVLYTLPPLTPAAMGWQGLPLFLVPAYHTIPCVTPWAQLRHCPVPLLNSLQMLQFQRVIYFLPGS